MTPQGLMVATCNDECPLLPVDRHKFQEIARSRILHTFSLSLQLTEPYLSGSGYHQYFEHFSWQWYAILEEQKEAQAELDKVLNGGLPEHTDIASLLMSHISNLSKKFPGFLGFGKPGNPETLKPN